MPTKYIKNQGYAVLFAVLIVNAAALMIVSSIMIWGIYFHKSGITQLKSEQARNLAEACIEAGLWDIREDKNVMGTYSLNMDTGSCSYVISGTSPKKTIESEGVVGDVYQRVVIYTNQVDPVITVSSWEEVSDF